MIRFSSELLCLWAKFGTHTHTHTHTMQSRSYSHWPNITMQMPSLS